jgi:hypothetical protein
MTKRRHSRNEAVIRCTKSADEPQVVALLLQCRHLGPQAARWRCQFNDGCPMCHRGLEFGHARPQRRQFAHQFGITARLALMPLPPGALALCITQCHTCFRYA